MDIAEVEVKYKVYDEYAVKKVLESVVGGLQTLQQNDQAYAETTWQYGMDKVGRTFARLRKQTEYINGDVVFSNIFTVKKPIDNEMACLEFETNVDNYDQMHNAIILMKFYPTVKISKKRYRGHIDNMSVCLDHIEHIGTFLEVERCVDSNVNCVAVQDKLNDFVLNLEKKCRLISTFRPHSEDGPLLERITETYDSIMKAAE